MIQSNEKRSLLVDYTKKRAPISGKHLLGQNSAATWRNLTDVNHHVSIIGASYSMFDSISSLEESTRSLKTSASCKHEFSLPRRTKSSNASNGTPREIRLPTKECSLRSSAETMPSPITFRIRRQSFERSNSFDASKFSSCSREHLQLETSLAETETVSSTAEQGDSKDRSVCHERDRSASPAPGSFRNPLRRTKSTSSATGGREVIKTSSKLGSCRSLLRPTKSMSQEAMERCLQATAQCQVQEARSSGPHLQLRRSMSSDENIGTLRQLNRSGSTRSLRSKNTVETDNKTNSEDASTSSCTSSRSRVRRKRSSSKKHVDHFVDEIKRSGSTRSLNHSGSGRNLMHASISTQLTAHTEFSDDCTAHLFVTGSRIKRHDGASRRDSSSDSLHKLCPKPSQDSTPRLPRRKGSNGRLEDNSEHETLHDRAPRLPNSRSRPPASVNLLDSLDTSFSYASSSEEDGTSSHDSFCCDSSMRSLGSSISTHRNEKPKAALVRPLTPPPTGSQSFSARVA